MNYSVIIAEFNPFSNGHKLIIEETKKMFPNDGIIVLMSGNFVQRGEPAITNKKNRAEVACSIGADAVIELPVVFSNASAEDFAYGAVKMASSINGAVRIVFGSECGNINLLNSVKTTLLNNITKEKIKKNLKQGNSFASSVINSLNDTEKAIMSKPNNILGIEYLKAIKTLNSHLIPITIKRLDNFNSLDATNIASATALREIVKTNQYSELKNKMPDLMLDKIKQSQTPSLDKLFSFIYLKILSLSTNELLEIEGVSEGLEHRIKRQFKGSHNFGELVSKIASKRYPQGKIRRILINILLNITKEIKTATKQTTPYLNILCVGKQKNQILKDLKGSIATLIVKNKDQESLNADQKAIFNLNILADQIYEFLTIKSEG